MRSFGTLLLLLVSASARAGDDPGAAERDLLIDRIIRGVDEEASVRRLAELVHQRDRVAAAAEAARTEERDRETRDRESRERMNATLDGRVARYCQVTARPAQPPFARWAWDEEWADWGRVTRREEVRVPGPDALADDQVVVMLEIAGARRRYRIADEKRELNLVAGDLALVCATRDADHDPEYRRNREKMEGHPSIEERLPPAWQGIEHHHPTVVRLAATPRLAAKTAWDPLFVSANDFRWAIRDVKWSHGDRHIVTFARVLRMLAPGLYEMDAEDDRPGLAWLMEVPPSVNARAVVAERGVWAILRNARFDRARKRLVLTAVDLEASYFVEK